MRLVQADPEASREPAMWAAEANIRMASLPPPGMLAAGADASGIDSTEATGRNSRIG